MRTFTGRQHIWLVQVTGKGLASALKLKLFYKEEIFSDPDAVEITILPHDHSPLSEDHIDKFMEQDAKWPTRFWTQYATLTHRNFVHSRSRILSKLHLVQTIVLAIFTGALWWQTPRSEETLRDRAGIVSISAIF